MNNTSFDDGLTYFFSQRIHGRDVSNNMLELAEPESEWERMESVIADILRWADDGGKMLDPVEDRTAGSNPDMARERRNK
jgi:hypothetical protein